MQLPTCKWYFLFERTGEAGGKHTGIYVCCTYLPHVLVRQVKIRVGVSGLYLEFGALLISCVSTLVWLCTVATYCFLLPSVLNVCMYIPSLEEP